MQNLIEIGYLSKIIGYKGANLLQVKDGMFVGNPEFLFLQFDLKPVPFKIVQLEDRPNGVMVHFEDVDDEAKAKDIVGRTVWAEEADMEFDEEFVDYGLLEGYSVEEVDKGFVGKVVSVIENGPNVVLELEWEGKELMLPFQEDLVLDIDHDNRVISYEAPEGLIEMYVE